MKICILNGNPEPSALDLYLAALERKLESEGHLVTQLELRELDLRYCVGCFGCWVKSPGECVVGDASREIDRAVINSDFTLWAAPLKMGFPSALLKMALDKSIPLIHPYFEVAQGEAHHRKRYKHYPRLGLLLEREPDTDQSDLEIVAAILGRTALNMKSSLEFALTTESPVEEVAGKMTSKAARSRARHKNLPAIPGESIQPPQHVTIFNGSPRGRKGNTSIMLQQFGEGFASIPGHSYEMFHLNRVQELALNRDRWLAAECVWLGFPLYTDAMPGLVKAFIERLEPGRGRGKMPPVGFLVQSGFPEAIHSRYVERYLQQLAERLEAPYLGTIVKGGGEAVRWMPEQANRKLFEALQGLGRELAEYGRLEAGWQRTVAGVERYPALLAPFFKLFVRLPIASWHWDQQLKQNEVCEERFAQPFVDPS